MGEEGVKNPPQRVWAGDKVNFSVATASDTLFHMGLADPFKIAPPRVAKLHHMSPFEEVTSCPKYNKQLLSSRTSWLLVSTLVLRKLFVIRYSAAV